MSKNQNNNTKDVLANVSLEELLKALSSKGVDVNALQPQKLGIDSIDSKTKFWESRAILAEATKEEILSVFDKLTAEKEKKSDDMAFQWINGTLVIVTEKYGQSNKNWTAFKEIFTANGMTHEGSVKKNNFKWIISKPNFDKAMADWNKYMTTGSYTVVRK